MSVSSRNRTYCLVLVALWFLILCPSAYAYLDPGTGAFLLQLLVAGIVGSAFAIKIFWRRIKAFLSRLSSRSRDGGGKNGQS